MLSYEVKLLPEAVFAALTAAVAAVLQLLNTTDLSTMETGRFWLVMIGAAVARAAIGAVIQTVFGKGPAPTGGTP